MGESLCKVVSVYFIDVCKMYKTLKEKKTQRTNDPIKKCTRHQN